MYSWIQTKEKNAEWDEKKKTKCVHARKVPVPVTSTLYIRAYNAIIIIMLYISVCVCVWLLLASNKEFVAIRIFRTKITGRVPRICHDAQHRTRETDRQRGRKREKEEKKQSSCVQCARSGYCKLCPMREKQCIVYTCYIWAA